MNEGLLNLLQINESITEVYFNEEGEWQFVPLSGFVKTMTRDEILNPTEPETKKSKSKN